MTTETITDYETREVEREVTYSDLSGREIPQGDVVSLAVNPHNDVEDEGILPVCEGNVHLHVDELAELNGIDPDDIDADAELPEWYVKKESPEVVEKSYFNLKPHGDEKMVWWGILAQSGLLLLWFQYMHSQFGTPYPGHPGLLGIVGLILGLVGAGLSIVALHDRS